MPSLRFGTAGIRGRFNEEVTTTDCFNLSCAIDHVLSRGRYGISHDTRKTSALLTLGLTAGFNWFGDDVVDFGLLPTPVLAFNTRELGLKAGLSVTASHNPPEYVGIKIFNTLGIELPVSAERKIERALRRVSFVQSPIDYGTTKLDSDAVDRYLERLVPRLPESRKKLALLVDCANGAGIQATPYMLRQLGHHVLTLHSHPSWRFPGRLPEPTTETLKETADLVRRLNVDLGVAHDGDADRVVFIDRGGQIVPDYLLSALMLKLVVTRRRGPVVLSVNTSNAVEEVAAAHGCPVTRARLGKTFTELYRQRGVYATEPSKVVDAAWGFWEDGIYAAAVVVQAMASTGASFAELVQDIPQYVDLQADLTFRALDRGVLEARVKEYFLRRRPREVVETDGWKFVFADGWVLLRPSGTEPKVRVYAEAKGVRRAQGLLAEGVRVVRAVLS